MHLSRFPRVRLCHAPTPLEPMENLSRLLGGPRLFIKRDDCTGLASGGNKTRKLEFLMGEAIRQDADTVITQGAVQSNHVRQAAAAACKLGFKCEIILERRVQKPGPRYETSGNVFLDHLFDAKLRYVPAGTDMNAALAQVAEEVKQMGGKPYVIPGGGSNPVGALGYANCAFEIVQQANDLGLKVDTVVHATGSAGTQAGLVAGFEGLNSGVKVYGISVRQTKNELQEESVYKLTAATADYMGIRGGVDRAVVKANGAYVGGGYGVPTPGMIEAVRLLARHEGILLDPVYTGKGMAGLIDLCRKGVFAKDETVVFVHTGGAVALFAYEEAFA